MCQEPARPLCPITLTASVQGPKVGGLTGSCPTQLVAVSLITSNRGPRGRTGKGAMTANRGRNTFHCPPVPKGGSRACRDSPNWWASTQWGAGGPAEALPSPHSSPRQQGPGEPPPAASPLSLPQAWEQTLPSPSLNPSLCQGAGAKGRTNRSNLYCHQELRDIQMGQSSSWAWQPRPAILPLGEQRREYPKFKPSQAA